MNQINSDWHGNTLPFNFSYHLLKEKEFISYEVEVKPYLNSEISKGSGKFQSGLWKKDVIELFIKEVGNPQYYEFHIAPNGMWWAAKFSSYREMSMELEQIDISPSAVISSNKTLKTSLKIPLNVLEFSSHENLQFHVSAIFGSEKKSYICLLYTSPSPRDATLSRMPSSA